MNRQRLYKRALVTGATRGIGRAISEKLAAAGYELLLVASNQEDLEAFLRDLRGAYAAQEFMGLAVDLSVPEEIQRACTWALDQHPDILVNNAGVFRAVSLLNEPPESFLPQFYVNYYAAHALSIALAQQMKNAGRGYIFNITSTASRDPVKAGAYTVTKFALHGLTRVLREELRGSGVKVTEIVPGSTLTSSWAGTNWPEDCFVKPIEIAKAVRLCLEMGDSTLVEEMTIKPSAGNIVTDC